MKKLLNWNPRGGCFGAVCLWNSLSCMKEPGCVGPTVDGKDAPNVWGPELHTVLRLSIKAWGPSPLRCSHHQSDQAPAQGKDPGTSTSKDHFVWRIISPLKDWTSVLFNFQVLKMEMLFFNTLYFYQNSLQETECGSPVVPAAGGVFWSQPFGTRERARARRHVAPVWPLAGGPWRPLCVSASGFSSVRDHIRQPPLLSRDLGKKIDQRISVILKVELNTELFISNSIVESQPKRRWIE